MQTIEQKNPISLKLWERIRIIVGEEGSEGFYVARIEDFSGDKIIISKPELSAGETLLRNDCDCEVQVTRDDAVYMFHTRIHLHVDDTERQYWLDNPDKITRIQRRQFVRIDMWQKIRYACVKSVRDPQHTCITSLQWHDTASINVSGGGILIKTNGEVQVDDLVIIRTPLFDEIGIPDIIAGICRRSFQENGECVSGIEFLLDDQIDSYLGCDCARLLPESIYQYSLLMQNRLVIYIFRQQLELRKKGLL